MSTKRHQQYITRQEAMEWEIKSSRLVWLASWTGWRWVHLLVRDHFIRRTNRKYERYQNAKSRAPH
jgi:hypothetical protein